MTGIQRHLERIASKQVPNSLKPYLRTVRDNINNVQNWREHRRRLQEAPIVDPSGQDVLVIAVDCLRADHTMLHDYHRDTTPFLATFPGQYRHAVTPAPWTYSSVTSLLSGRYPHNHGALPQGEFRNFDDQIPQQIDDDVFFLSELLGNAGYDTLALTSIGFANIATRGRFSSSQYLHDANAEQLVDEALKWWHDRDTPRFAYLHLADLHEPMAIPEDHPFGDIEKVNNLRRWDFCDTTTPEESFQKYRTEKIRLYDTLIRYVDSELQRLYNGVTEGEDQQPLVIITGDHGEEFWEHVDIEREKFKDPRGYSGIGHGHGLFNEVVNVPLVIDHPVVNGQSDEWCSLVDLAPTLLDLLDVSPRGEMDGRSLLNDRDEPILSEAVGYGYEKKAIFNDGYKLVQSPQDDVTLLYDLDQDYAEQTPVDDSAVEEELAAELTTIDEVYGGKSLSIDETSKEHLRDLGYFER